MKYINDGEVRKKIVLNDTMSIGSHIKLSQRASQFKNLELNYFGLTMSDQGCFIVEEWALGISDGLMHLPQAKEYLEHLDMTGMAHDDHRRQYVTRWADLSDSIDPLFI